ncbi:MotA/TolQ/ExbB proton channel family protein [Coralloluteibacterium thermophilus]|uniref:Biopolymer transport protein ExbB n=1 Tax=Coralloluteibacterium thermophilum TaxID=2707049 RepID=A0ABV9NLJ0_9GAMM
MQQFGFIEAMSHAHWVNWTMLIILIIMSIGSWYLFVTKLIRNSVIKSRADKVTRTFWETPNAADAIRFMEEQPKNEPFSKIALDAAQAAAHHQRSEGSRLTETMSRSEFIDRALRQAVTRESSKLENGQTFLASTGATAPFIGLLGTVWGILMALITIGQTGNASIDAVAGPVGEALYMTAIGLGVAIPAVFFFNFFTRQNYEINAKFDVFAHDLHDFFATGARVGETAPPATKR